MQETSSTADPIWLNWIGLPHQVGEDPRNGRGACCLVMARILLTEAGEYFPDIEDQLLTFARDREWGLLTNEFHRYTEPVVEPVPWVLTLIQNGPIGLGIGTVVPGDYLLLPHHRRGVRAIPLNALRPLSYHRVLPGQ